MAPSCRPLTTVFDGEANNELDTSGHPKLKAKGAGSFTSQVDDYQISLFAPQQSVIEKELRDLDTDSLTPLQALQKIAEWKKRVAPANKSAAKAHSPPSSKGV